MKTLTFLTAIFMNLLVFSQDRIQFSGTRITMIPPSNPPINLIYFPIIREEDRYEISAMEFGIGDYNMIRAEVDSAAYARAGYDVVKQSRITVDDFQMRIVWLKAGHTGAFKILYGDSTTFLAKISVSYTAHKEPDLPEKLMNAIQSIKVNRVSVKEIDWGKHLVIIPPVQNAFKFVEGSYFGKLQFSRDGKQTRNLWSESSVIVKQLPGDDETTNQKIVMELMADFLTMDELELLDVIYEGNATVDGKEVYQFIADCRVEEKTVRFNVFGYLGKDYSLFLQSMAFNQEDIAELERFIQEMKLK
ncbi:hypothetical protein H9Y05_09340 [Crocinitomicaceae bacterium CZZ-1]|uniref:Uncharacterized protein n=1 Tax=Taishania pollutisoli TaxID=2766479 RepID=A0A8J6PJA5_9FLAO|nr:hypothetical protein [Taishania pollutisoli]MBC9812674.1 hypothetical protein [Taishania pollutisoli]MBX2949171.1 hypothetical protein [Crocinitomicaceae bacterium]NGF75897.1 hypothetical protein [Fluviicola sp. SGL-29]